MVKKIFIISITFFSIFVFSTECLTTDEIQTAADQTFCLNTDSAFDCGIEKSHDYLMMSIRVALDGGSAAYVYNREMNQEFKRQAKFERTPLESVIQEMNESFVNRAESTSEHLNESKINQMIRKYSISLGRRGIQKSELPVIETKMRKYFDALQDKVQGQRSDQAINTKKWSNKAANVKLHNPNDLPETLDKHVHGRGLTDQIYQSRIRSNQNSLRNARIRGTIKGGLAGAATDLAVALSPIVKNAALEKKCSAKIKSKIDTDFIHSSGEFEFNCNLNVTDEGWQKFLDLNPAEQTKLANSSDLICTTLKNKIEGLKNLDQITSGGINPKKIKCDGQNINYELYVAGKKYQQQLTEKHDGYTLSSTFANLGPEDKRTQYDEFSIGINKEGQWQSSISNNPNWRPGGTNTAGADMTVLKNYIYENRKCEVLDITNRNELRLPNMNKSICSVGKQLMAAQRNINEVINYCNMQKIIDENKAQPAKIPSQNNSSSGQGVK
jgi:hypothetical protein